MAATDGRREPSKITFISTVAKPGLPPLHEIAVLFVFGCCRCPRGVACSWNNLRNVGGALPSFQPLAALASSSALYQCLKRPGCKTGRHHVILAPTATTAIINIVILILIIIFIISIIIFIFIIFIITITSLFVFSKGLGSTVARRANLQRAWLWQWSRSLLACAWHRCWRVRLGPHGGTRTSESSTFKLLSGSSKEAHQTNQKEMLSPARLQGWHGILGVLE